MKISPLAGHPPPPAMLLDVAKLITAYYAEIPDPSVPAQRVAFGTSGHRGSSFEKTFNEWHVLAISEAICRYRRQQGIGGPLFLGFDTHALSVPACTTAVEVLAADGIDIMLAEHDAYTPTPAVSHAILSYNRGRTTSGALASRSDARERRGGSDVPVHVGGLGLSHPDGPVVVLCDAAADRPEGPLRHRLRLRYGSRSAWGRHAEHGAPAAQSLSRGRYPASLPASAAVGRGRRGREDCCEQRHDRSGEREARPAAPRGAGRLQVVRRGPRRRVPRLLRGRECRSDVAAPRRNRVDHGQGWHRAGTARGRDHGAGRPRPGRALR